MEKKYFTTADGKKMEVPLRGSLGLLAYGAVGIRIWREVRVMAQQEKNAGKNDTEQNVKTND